MFRNAAEGAHDERKARLNRGKNLLKLGVDYLDDALVGLAKDDFTLIGAPSGSGKTALCVNIALANLADGKRVHMLALEAGEFEIESRLKFRLIADQYFADNAAPRLPRGLTFDEWYLGRIDVPLAKYEAVAAEFFASAYRGLSVFYKRGAFDVSNFIETVLFCAKDTDLILVDHAHYFDFAEQDDNRAMKQLARTCQALALEQGKPIVLVAHLRKRDRGNQDLVASMDEFHGSSDLTKIATRVITCAPGRPTASGGFETFFRVCKNRLNLSSTNYVGRAVYQPQRGAYDKGYRIGWASQQRGAEFEDLELGARPSWAVRGEQVAAACYPAPSRPPIRVPVTRRAGADG